ncbi:uncharacterized protein TrAtP1_011365 [Trichoderma atroviride]|uniref:uncharacterized protein n=1 Tax=Hypocrea atroviridis TaxID=63577 RepID=UPI00332285D3|nr:hypothetical protein TrAtP1_011365 [Trichoderma atroviride]
MAPTGYTDGDGHLEAGLLKSTQGEKQTGYQDYSPLALKTKTRSNKMIYFRRALLVIVMGFVLGLGVATARPSLMNCQRHSDNSNMDLAKAHSSNGELAEALQKASPDLLHRLLHAYLPERYQHGVFATDKDAIDAISERDPSVASAIVQIAKRQDNGPSNSNSTTAAPTSTAPSSTAVQSSTDVQSSTASSAESTTASETSSSDSSSSTAESTTADSSSSSAPASTTAESTTASEQSTTAAPSSTPSSAPASTTSSASSTSEESVTQGPSSTEASETPQSTITSGSKTTSAPVAHTFTRTLPDGGTTTLTSTSWVAVLPTSHADGSKNPDLQNAASHPRGEMMMPAAIGLLVGAVLLA